MTLDIPPNIRHIFLMCAWNGSFLHIRIPDDEEGPRRGRKAKRPHRPATVEAVRRLYETTDMTYVEIAAETGTAPASVCRWSQAGGWRRPSHAPVCTSSEANGLASSALKGRVLAKRLRDLAERMMREMEAADGVDPKALAGALDLLRQAKVAEKPTRRKGPRPADPPGTPEGAHAAASARLALSFPDAAPERPLPRPEPKLKKGPWGRAAKIPFADTLPSPHPPRDPSLEPLPGRSRGGPRRRSPAVHEPERPLLDPITEAVMEHVMPLLEVAPEEGMRQLALLMEERDARDFAALKKKGWGGEWG